MKWLDDFEEALHRPESIIFRVYLKSCLTMPFVDDDLADIEVSGTKRLGYGATRRAIEEMSAQLLCSLQFNHNDSTASLGCSSNFESV